MSGGDSGNGEMITPQDDMPLGSLWLPLQGAEVRELVAHLDLGRESSERLVSEATSILGKCIPPQGPADSTTGLVLGYVQSGKTMSFTTVAALARDNGYPMVIVITGISNPLLDQSTRRLEQDLRLQDNRKWRLFRNPKVDDRQSIADVLAAWRDQRLPDHRRKTVLITVLKSTTNLRNLNRVLQQLDLRTTPVLVIDDEADQAGLNTRAAQGAQSTTYQRLVTLRQNLPHHGYLQYTATPQAPLLINIIDVLSPRFAELLTPGDDYVGGDTFSSTILISCALFRRSRFPAGATLSRTCRRLCLWRSGYSFLGLRQVLRLDMISSAGAGTARCLCIHRARQQATASFFTGSRKSGSSG